VQAVLLAVLEAARANRIERPDELVRFVLGTCRNVALRARQKDAQLQPAEPEELDVLAFVPTFEHVDTGALVRCLGHLDHRSRTVVMLSF
jgi:DNA-directed RNA polymerase specialized sigma24 family protein